MPGPCRRAAIVQGRLECRLRAYRVKYRAKIIRFIVLRLRMSVIFNYSLIEIRRSEHFFGTKDARPGGEIKRRRRRSDKHKRGGGKRKETGAIRAASACVITAIISPVRRVSLSRNNVLQQQ